MIEKIKIVSKCFPSCHDCEKAAMTARHRLNGLSRSQKKHAHATVECNPGEIDVIANITLTIKGEKTKISDRIECPVY